MIQWEHTKRDKYYFIDLYINTHIGQATWGMYLHLAGDQSFLVFLVPIHLNFKNFDGFLSNQVAIVLHRAWNRYKWRKFC